MSVTDVCGNVLFIETPGDLLRGEPFQCPPEDLLHDGRSIRIRDQVVPFFGIREIPEGSAVGASEPRVLSKAGDLPAPAGGLPGIPVVDQVHKGEKLHLPVPEGIYIVQDGQEPDTVPGEDLFRIPGALQVVAPEPGDIRDDHGIDPAVSDLFQHSLETGAVKMGAGYPNVREMTEGGKSVLIGEFFQDLFLVLDGKSVDLRLPFLRDPFIQCGNCFHHSDLD